MQNLINALKHEDLTAIGITLSSHHRYKSAEIDKLGNIPPTQRAILFWDMVEEIADHRTLNRCNVTIEEINFIY